MKEILAILLLVLFCLWICSSVIILKLETEIKSLTRMYRNARDQLEISHKELAEKFKEAK